MVIEYQLHTCCEITGPINLSCCDSILINMVCCRDDSGVSRHGVFVAACITLGHRRGVDDDLDKQHVSIKSRTTSGLVYYSYIPTDNY